MKKRKKNTKKKKKMKLMIIGGVFVLILGVFVTIYLLKPKYLNSTKGCDVGYYFYNVFYKSGCDICPKGQYCPGDNKHYNCPRGTTTSSTGKSWEFDCDICTDDSKYFDGSTCTPCKQGYYCKGGKLNKCPNGKTTKSTGARNVSDCVCTAGTYKSGETCKSCPKCNGITCFTSPIGSTSVNQCNGTVPAGKYITCNSSGCNVNTCTGDTISKAQNVKYSSSLKTTCTKCASNQISNAAHTKCLCVSGTYASGNKCNSCPKCDGKTCFTSPLASTSVNQCTATVAAGKYITCNSNGCSIKNCTGNTYSTKKSVKYSSSLKTTCTSCGNKKANSSHTGCV